MSKQEYGIVPGEASSIHDEAHIEGSRITVRFVHDRVESGIEPETVAEQHDLPLADVYEALAYYHKHPEEMHRAEKRHRRAVEAGGEHVLTGPDDR
jgi:uncharacterized protein (DUF433 family)